MSESDLIQLAMIILLGILAQWIGWRIRLPSILVLLVFGILAGPVFGLLHIDAIFGELLFPVVSFSVALILFEGGLSLRLSELREVGRIVWNLVTIGALVVWIILAAAAYYVLRLSLPLAILLGATLIVSGPTVVLPLLVHVRPAHRLGSILKWEGIVIDPIGATLAVLVLEVILSGEPGSAIGMIALGVLKAVLSGGLIGLVGAGLIVLLIRRHLLPEFLQNPTAFVLVIAAFALSNHFQEESGLLAVTLMGVLLANQKLVDIRHIVEFKENLRVLLLSGLFILLAARVNLADLLAELKIAGLIFLLAAILIARPLSVFLSTIGSGLSLRERLFLSWIAPRGIVAASVASVFVLLLSERGVSGAERLSPITFLTIIATVAIYGLSATPVARWLKVVQLKPSGVLFLGAHSWVRRLAAAVKSAGFRALMVDTNYANVVAAREEGLEAHHGSILSEDFLNEVDLEGIGKLAALTSNDEVNTLAAIRMAEIFTRSNVYQLCSGISSKVSQEMCGRALFGQELTFSRLENLFDRGAGVQQVKLDGGQTFEELRKGYGERFLPLFLVTENHDLEVFTSEDPITPRRGQTVIGLFEDGLKSDPAAQADFQGRTAV